MRLDLAYFGRDRDPLAIKPASDIWDSPAYHLTPLGYAVGVAAVAGLILLAALLVAVAS